VRAAAYAVAEVGAAAAYEEAAAGEEAGAAYEEAEAGEEAAAAYAADVGEEAAAAYEEAGAEAACAAVYEEAAAGGAEGVEAAHGEAGAWGRDPASPGDARDGFRPHGPGRLPAQLVRHPLGPRPVAPGARRPHGSAASSNCPRIRCRRAAGPLPDLR
jgi:hypothetical protein